MPNLYVYDTYNHVATTTIDGGGYTSDSGHTWSLYPATTQSIACDGSRHASTTTGFGFELSSYTPVVGQRLRFKVHLVGSLTTFDQIGGLFYVTTAGGGTMIQAFLGRDSISGLLTCYAAAQVTGVADTAQTATFATITEGDLFDITVTGTGPNVVTFKQNGTTIATLTLSNAPYYISAPGLTGLRYFLDAGSPVLFYGATWVGPVSPTFTLTAGSTSLTVGGATTTVTPANFNGVPTYTSSNPSVATVNSSGVVTPIAPGTCTVTATDAVFTDFTAVTATITVISGTATTYTVSGPGSGIVGFASSNFTITPNGSGSEIITITPSGGGLSTPIVKTFTDATPQTFTITPTALGVVTLTPTNNAGLTNPAAPTYTAGAAAATTYTITGPTSGVTGTASSAFTITPNGTGTETITITPSGGGLTTPIVRMFTSASPLTFTITPTVAGVVTLVPTNNAGLTNPASPTYTAITNIGPVTGYTFTGPTTGAALAASTAFTITPNGPGRETITITPSGGGLTLPVVKIFADLTPQTFTITPAYADTIVLTPTNDSGLANPLSLTYTSTSTATLTVLPGSVPGEAWSNLHFVGTGTSWQTAAPRLYSPSPVFFDSLTVLSDTTATTRVYVGRASGTALIVEGRTGAVAHLVVGSGFLFEAPYGPAYSGLTLGYTVYDVTWGVAIAHVAGGLIELAGTGLYKALVALPFGFIGTIVADAPSGVNPWLEAIDMRSWQGLTND